MKSFDELAHEAKWGKISKDEILYVAKTLRNFKPGEDSDDLLHTLIYILGFAGTSEYRNLVEPFICYRECDFVCSQALKTLCTCWGLTEDYLETIKMYIRGVGWDYDDVRIIAMSIAGAFLRKKFDRELLQLLVDVFEGLGEIEGIHEEDDSKREFLKGCAYLGLARAVGEEWGDILDGEEVVKFIAEGKLTLLDLPVVQKAHQMLQKNKR
jgi:hypothetical protein